MFHTKFVEKIKTRFMFNKFLSENRVFYEIRTKTWRIRRGHRWQYNTAHVYCMLNNSGYKHTRKSLILNVFPRKQWLSECASMLRTLPVLLKFISVDIIFVSLELSVSCSWNSSPLMKSECSLPWSQQSVTSFVFGCCVVGTSPNPKTVEHYISTSVSGNVLLYPQPTVRDWTLHFRKEFKNTVPVMTYHLTWLRDLCVLVPPAAWYPHLGG